MRKAVWSNEAGRATGSWADHRKLAGKKKKVFGFTELKARIK